MTLQTTEMPVATDLLRQMYGHMVLMCEIHNRAIALQRQGRIGSWLGSEGQEAAIVGSAYALAPEDWAFPSYREHALALVRGKTPVELFHHLYGNSLDTIKGRNLPPEYSFRDINFVSVSAPVGTQVPQAVGAAMAAQVRGDRLAVITYFGDGTSSEGDIHTAMAFAGKFRAPVVFFCQNNGWAISVPTAKQTAGSIVDRAGGHGFDGIRVNGNDPLEVYEATRMALDKARNGDGPTLIEAMTYRLGAHSTSDDPSRYHDPEVHRQWQDQDPILLLANRLGLSEGEREAIQAEVKAAVEAAVDLAENTPLPQKADLFEGVYGEMPWHLREQAEKANRA